PAALSGRTPPTDHLASSCSPESNSQWRAAAGASEMCPASLEIEAGRQLSHGEWDDSGNVCRVVEWYTVFVVQKSVSASARPATRPRRALHRRSEERRVGKAASAGP